MAYSEANPDLRSFSESQSYSPARQSRITASQESYSPTLPSLEASGVEAIITALRKSGLPGPSIVTGPMTWRGQGGQFVVYQAELIIGEPNSFRSVHIAAKQPIFDGPSQQDNPISMADKRSQLRLQNIATEIRALTTPDLRQHPNIVRLISWTFDPYKVHRPVTLAMELALSDLGRLLDEEKGKDVSCQQRYAFCVDVANGLDALHDHGLVHGDLKPENVLVFQGAGDRLVAKLADFGMSTTGETNQEVRAQKLAGTPGWQAPEVEQDQPLLPRGLQLADNYSFGLLSWSTVFASGKPLTRKIISLENLVMAPVLNGIDIEPEIMTIMGKALPQLLNQDPKLRAHKLLQLFTLDSRYSISDARVDEGSGNGEKSSHRNLADDHDDKVPLEDFKRSKNSSFRFPWELPGKPNEFWRATLPHFMDDVESGRPDVIFAFFLESTTHGGRITLNAIPGNRRSEISPVTLLLAAAARGYPPAQALIPEVLAFYQMDATDAIHPPLVQNLESAVKSGSTCAKGHLQILDAAIFSNSVRCFRESGGYGPFYRTKTLSSELHRIVSYGKVDELQKILLDDPGIDVDSRTGDNESPLYLACARGAWEMAIELLDRGADSKRGNTINNVSCLHWVFSFDPSVQADAVKRLLDNGANINASTSGPTPFFHYPFILPPGTPLHWAVVLKENVTIQALVEAGADLTIRDGFDPYRYDERVRIIGTFRNLDDDAFSYSECGTKGLAPWDHASMNREPFIFECVLWSGRDVHDLINAIDEEGFTVLHRLSTVPLRWTRFDVCYSFIPISGQSCGRQDTLIRMVEVIKALGGNLEQLTTPNAAIAQAKQNKGQNFTFQRYTPLMMAALGGFADVVKALVHAGAYTSTANEEGTTALHCLSFNRPEQAKEIVELLIDAGADVHQTTNDGISLLQRVASSRNLPLLETLLSHRANIEETDDNHRSPLEGSSCFAHFATRNYFPSDVFAESHDVALGSLLKKYLLGHENADKRIRFMARRGRRQPQTLLHEFSRSFMRHTVAALILCDAPVNAPSYVWISRALGKGVVLREQYALDSVLRAKESYEHEMLRENGGIKSTTGEHLHICSRADSVIRTLEHAGGLRCPMTTVEKPEN